jgi:hypothetical protein
MATPWWTFFGIMKKSDFNSALNHRKATSKKSNSCLSDSYIIQLFFNIFCKIYAWPVKEL